MVRCEDAFPAKPTRAAVDPTRQKPLHWKVFGTGRPSNPEDPGRSSRGPARVRAVDDEAAAASGRG